MTSMFVEKCTTELLKLYKEQHEVLYGGQHPLCLNVPCLLYLQRKFAQLQETSGGPIPPTLVSLQTLRDHLSRTLSFKLIPDRFAPPLSPTASFTISLEPFRALQVLQMKRVPLCLLVGLQRLRGQLRVLVLHRCDLEQLEDLVVRCGADNSTCLAWPALKEIDLSNNKVTKLGHSLQYMHSLEKVNFSNNVIGKRPRGSVEASGSGGSEPGGNHSSPAVTSIELPSLITADTYTEGIESIDNVQFLHLGFNKLHQVPRFGSRAKYNLRVLNLRNNELVTIEGLEELDNLVDLDLTDNLLSKHSSLKPFHNLHHLAVLSLQGNPVVFHPKHRLRTAENLSNLIDKGTFRLDGKKLSNAEKKVVPTTMTHYRSFKPHPQPLPTGKGFTTSINGTTTDVPFHLRESLLEKRVSMGGADQGQGSTQHNTGTQNKKSRKTYNAVIVDSDDEHPSSLLSPAHNGDISEKLKASLHAHMEQDKEELVVLNKHRNKQKGSSKKKKKKDKTASDSEGVSAPPLIHQEEIKRSNDMRKMIPDYWLQGSMDKSSSATEEATAAPSSTRGGSQSSTNQNTSATSSDVLSSGTGNSPRQSDKDVKPGQLDKESRHDQLDRKSRHGQSGKESGHGQSNKESRHGSRTKLRQQKENVLDDAVVDVALEECEGTFGPRTSSPERVSPAEIDGDHYVVERYESDVEDDRMTNGDVASGGGASRGDRDQVILRLSDKFLDEIDSNGRFIDRWDLHSLLAVSVESKYWKPCSRQMEVLLLHFNLERRDRCKRAYVLMEEGVGEGILATLKPVLQQNQFTLSMGNKLECLQCQRIVDRSQAKDHHGDSPDIGHYSTSFNRKNISNLMCPYCHSHILQQSMRSSFKSGSLLDKLSQGSPNNGAAAVADPFPIYTASTRVYSGFEVEDRSRTSVEGEERNTPSESLEREQNSQFGSAGVQDLSGMPKATSDRTEKTFKCEPLHNGSNNGVLPMNGDNSPTEGSYLQGFDDGSFAETERTTSTSLSEKDPNTGPTSPTAATAAASSVPVNEDVLQPWVSASKKPLNPLNDPDFQRYRGNLKSSSQNFVGGGDSPDEFTGFARGSSDEEKYPGGFGKGKAVEEDHETTTTSATAEKDSWAESRNFLDYDYPDPSQYFPSSEAIAMPSGRNPRVDGYVFQTPNTVTSSSVPSQSNLFDAFLPSSDAHSEIKTERKGHGRSNSADLRKIKISSSPSSKKRLSRGMNMQDSDRSLTSVQEDNITSFENGFGNSRRSSMCSGESDSGAGSRSDSNSAASRVKKASQGSGDGIQKGYSSGETKQSKQKSMGSSEKVKEGSKFGKLSRVFSWSDLRPNTSPKTQNRKSSDKRQLSGSKSPGGSSSSGGSSSRKSSRKASATNTEGKSPTKLQPHSSSDGGGREKRAHSPITIYKDEDPSYIHNSLQLYLDMEILDSSREEKFKMVFRSSVVRYGEPGEVPVLAVISNLRAYLFRIIAPESSEPSKWLKLTFSHSLRKLVYIDHGVAYQYLRVEFKSPACYTFLMRNDKKCKLCSNLLSLCVADTPGSSLRNVGICVFNIEAIRHPEKILQEVVKSHYDAGGTPGQRSPTVDRLSPTKHSSTDNLLLYRLAFRRRQRSPRLSPVTLIVTNNSLYLAKENFAHWPLPRILALPPREALLPPYLDVEQKEIIDVERIVLDKEQVKFIVLCFFAETCNSGESCQWSLTLPSAECVTKLCGIIKTRWETDFQTAVPISYQ